MIHCLISGIFVDLEILSTAVRMRNAPVALDFATFHAEEAGVSTVAYWYYRNNRVKTERGECWSKSSAGCEFEWNFDVDLDALIGRLVGRSRLCSIRHSETAAKGSLRSWCGDALGFVIDRYLQSGNKQCLDQMPVGCSETIRLTFGITIRKENLPSYTRPRRPRGYRRCRLFSFRVGLRVGNAETVRGGESRQFFFRN